MRSVVPGQPRLFFVLVNQLMNGSTSLGDLQLTCYEYAGRMFTLDHRRLIALKIYCSICQLADAAIICNVRHPPFNHWERAKMQQTEGASIYVRVDKIGDENVYLEFNALQRLYWEASQNKILITFPTCRIRETYVQHKVYLQCKSCSQCL